MFRRSSAQTIDHKGIDPLTGEPFLRRYWLPLCGGYVRVDDHPLLLNPGLLGRQPVDERDRYWYALDMDDLSRLIHAQWQGECAWAAGWSRQP